MKLSPRLGWEIGFWNQGDLRRKFGPAHLSDAGATPVAGKIQGFLLSNTVITPFISLTFIHGIIILI